MIEVPRDLSEWQSVLGRAMLSADECRALADALQRPPPKAIRLRPDCPALKLPFRLTPVPWHERTYFVELPDEQPERDTVSSKVPPAQRSTIASHGGSTALTDHPGYFCGWYFVHDAGSSLALQLADVQPGETVCDLCAAPGGKATGLLENLSERGWLLANEAVADRVAALELNLARHGMSRYIVSQCDPEQLAATLSAAFDVVQVDAPCSGQSLVARGKQSISAFSKRQIAFCAARQRRILRAAAQLVRPGGRLVYTTCTFAIAENEDQIAEFLREHDGWTLEPVPGLAAWQSAALPGTYRLWPHRDRCGGAFGARLRRHAGEDPRARPTTRAPQQRANTLEWLDTLPEESTQWGTPLGTVYVWRQNWRVFMTAEPPPQSWWAVCYSGPEFCFRKGKTFFPAYALAMRHDAIWSPAQTTPLTDTELRDYVRGVPIRTSVVGWAVATYQGWPVGWLKGDGRLGKSHLPKPAKMLRG